MRQKRQLEQKYPTLVCAGLVSVRSREERTKGGANVSGCLMSANSEGRNTYFCQTLVFGALLYRGNPE